MLRALGLLTAVLSLLTCCEPTSETLVLGREVDGPLVLADGVELQDAYGDAEIRMPWSGYADRMQEEFIKIIYALIEGVDQDITEL